MPRWPDPSRSRGPRADPLTYPGELVESSYLWLDRWCYPLAVPGLGSRDWLVQVDGGPLVTAGGPASDVTTSCASRRSSKTTGAVRDLDGTLLAAGAAPMLDRRPVIAFGSNAAPAQLRDKFQRLRPEERVVPVMRASVQGFVLGHSPHVSDPGYLPFVLVGSGGAALAVFVLWLDSRQLGVLNRTEPNYELVQMSGGEHPLTLESSDAVASYSVYRGRWGALRWPGEAAPTPAVTQLELLTSLNRIAWFAAMTGCAEPRELLARFRADRSLRDRVRRGLAERGYAAPDGWAGDAK